MPTLFFSQLRLFTMKSPTTPFHSVPSRTFSSFPFFPFKLKHLAFRNVSFRTTRALSTRSEFPRPKIRRRDNRPPPASPSSPSASKSLVDDEAELSNWVDGLRTARVDTGFDGDSNRSARPSRSSRDSDNSFSRNPRFNRRFNRESEDDDDEGGGGRELRSRNGGGGGEFRPRNSGGGEMRSRNGGGGEFRSRNGGGGGEFRSRNSGVGEFRSRNSGGGEMRSRNGGGGAGGGELRSRKRSGDELWRGREGKSARVKPQLRSGGGDSDDEVVVGRRGLKGFLSSEVEDEEEEEEEVSEEESEDDDDEDEEIVKKSRSAMFGGETTQQKQAPRASSPAGGSESYLSDTRFDQCSISPLSLKGVKDAGYEKMTVVQEATLPLILKGKDVLAKARTGTGKTVAFLLPSIEVVAKSPPHDRDQRRPPILVLVICPTRELASQAAAEANKLLKYHPALGVQVVIGGTRLALEQKRMQANPCQILVATPGRLRDHTENTAGFASRLMGVKVLVLDEADHLLDMGFRKDIEKIIAAVPKQRQTLLFSATIPEEVRHICHIALKRDHEFVNTVQEGSEETHSQVRQMHLVAPLDKHFPFLYTLLKEHIADDVDYKVLVFCTTAMVTRLVAEMLGELNLNVREIHSRKPQSYRTRVSDEFRKSKGLILVTSDVSARGVDYPDVTLVIQVGLPSDREQYIHRLGRTGRRGKEGQGILLLAPWEEYFLSTTKDLPLEKAPVPSVDPDTKKKVEKALSHVEMKSKEAAYQAWLGYYNSIRKVGGDKQRLVELANEFSRCMGLDNPPAIPKLVLGKMGLRNIPGLRSK